MCVYVYTGVCIYISICSKIHYGDVNIIHKMKSLGGKTEINWVRKGVVGEIGYLSSH